MTCMNGQRTFDDGDLVIRFPNKIPNRISRNQDFPEDLPTYWICHSHSGSLQCYDKLLNSKRHDALPLQITPTLTMHAPHDYLCGLKQLASSDRCHGSGGVAMVTYLRLSGSWRPGSSGSRGERWDWWRTWQPQRRGRGCGTFPYHHQPPPETWEHGNPWIQGTHGYREPMDTGTHGYREPMDTGNPWIQEPMDTGTHGYWNLWILKPVDTETCGYWNSWILEPIDTEDSHTTQAQIYMLCLKQVIKHF